MEPGPLAVSAALSAYEEANATHQSASLERPYLQASQSPRSGRASRSSSLGGSPPRGSPPGSPRNQKRGSASSNQAPSVLPPKELIPRMSFGKSSTAVKTGTPLSARSQMSPRGDATRSSRVYSPQSARRGESIPRPPSSSARSSNEAAAPLRAQPAAGERSRLLGLGSQDKTRGSSPQSARNRVQ